MIEKLKKAAEFLGEEITIWENSKQAIINASYHDSECQAPVFFNPHEKEGRYLLVEILEKFTRKQRNKYIDLMFEKFKLIREKEHYRYNDFECWAIYAPSEICFDCIMEVIKK